MLRIYVFGFFVGNVMMSVFGTTSATIRGVCLALFVSVLIVMQVVIK